MKKFMSKDHILAICLIIFAVIVYSVIQTFPIPVVNSTGDPGPRLFPTLGVLLVIAGSIGLLLQKQETEKFMAKPEIVRLLKLAGFYVGYAAGLWGFGFLIATPIMLFFVMGLLAQEKKVNLIVRIVYSAGITFILYAAFVYLLKFKLPAGAIFNLL